MFLGEIRIFAGTFAPTGWRFCNGALVSISEYPELFEVIGVQFGGDGQETYALPDLRGRLPVHRGDQFFFGDRFGSETVTLTPSQIPSHTHPLLTTTSPGVDTSPEGRRPATPPTTSLYVRDTPDTALPGDTVSPTGAAQPHENRMPSIAVHYIISMHGIVPSPS